LGDVLREHVKPQTRGFKDDEKMQPYTDAGPEKLMVLMRPARTSVSYSQEVHFFVQLILQVGPNRLGRHQQVEVDIQTIPPTATLSILIHAPQGLCKALHARN